MSSGDRQDPAKGSGFGANDALAFMARGGAARPPLRPPVEAAPAPLAEAPLPEAKIVSAAYFRATDALRAGRSPAAIAAAVSATAALADQAWADARPAAEARKQPGFACAAGCAWCCHQQVAASPAEAVAIARHVTSTFAPEALAALKARLAALDTRSRGLGLWERARLKTPCAFLHPDGNCSIYEVRPLRCRGVYSRDAAHCRWTMENPDHVFGNPDRHAKPGPYPVEPAKIMDLALTGLARALNEVGLAWGALELTAALRVALETPDAGDRYAAGEAIFAGTELPNRDD